MRTGLAFLALVGVLPAGCALFAPEPEPLVAPVIATSTAYHAGSSLTGPLGTTAEGAIDEDPARAIACTCRVVYVERFDETWLAPLVNRSRLVLTSNAGEPFQSTAHLAPRARVGTAEEAREFLRMLDGDAKLRSVLVADETAVLPRGVTFVLSCAAKPETLAGGRLADRSADVEIARGEKAEGALQVALVLTGAVAEHASEAPADEKDEAPVVRVPSREAILLEDAPRIDGGPLVLIIPTYDPDKGAFVAVIQATSAPDGEPAAAEHAARVADVRERIGVVGMSARDRARELSRREAWSNQIGNVRRQLEDPARRRAALVFLATSTGAALVEDAAYTAGDAELAEVARIASEVTEDAVAIEAGAEAGAAERELGWALESRTYARFARLAADEMLAPELSGVLLRRAGECARWPDTIEDGLRRSRDAEALEAHFARENRIFLEDSAPGTRVRAYDWLASRGLAPKGFDPLAPEADRRRVIAALEAEAEAAAEAENQ
jgi:hypothetical protein